MAQVVAHGHLGWMVYEKEAVPTDYDDRPDFSAFAESRLDHEPTTLKRSARQVHLRLSITPEQDGLELLHNPFSDRPVQIRMDR